MKVDTVLKEVLKKIEPEKERIEGIEKTLKDFLKEFEKELKKFKISAEIFVGGSFAKGTVMKKDVYDADVFVRFDQKYDEKEISKLTKKALKKFKGVSVIHGSRDYFQVKKDSDFFIEVVPVMKVNSPKDAKNITDLSYSHVKYLNKKVKSKKIKDEIKLAKAFCYATKTYGAESYVSGFSGYALELLVCYYKGFLKFVREVSKYKGEKIVIDIEKKYSKKKNILLDLNSSKLISPIILIDPTFKERNALAALSEETFLKFVKEAKKFLKTPTIGAFEEKKVDLDKVSASAKKKGQEFLLIELKTNKQAGDIAGSKLLKFYKHLSEEVLRYFDIKNKGFNYNKKKSARAFFVVSPKKEIILEGPFLKDKKNVSKFKKEHKKTYSKSGKICAKEKVDFSLKTYLKKWIRKYSKKMKEMDIVGFEFA